MPLFVANTTSHLNSKPCKLSWLLGALMRVFPLVEPRSSWLYFDWRGYQCTFYSRPKPKALKLVGSNKNNHYHNNSCCRLDLHNLQPCDARKKCMLWYVCMGCLSCPIFYMSTFSFQHQQKIHHQMHYTGKKCLLIRWHQQNHTFTSIPLPSFCTISASLLSSHLQACTKYI